MPFAQLPDPPIIPVIGDGGAAQQDVRPYDARTLSQPVGERRAVPEPIPSGTAARAAVLDPVRRPLTLYLLTIAVMVLGIAELPFASDGPQYWEVVAVGFGLASAATFIGAGWARTPVAVRRGDPLVLVLAGIALTVIAGGFLVRRLRASFSWPLSVFDIGILGEVGGMLVLGVLCFVLAGRYADFRGGPLKRSPVLSLVAGGIGLILWWVPDIYFGTWFHASSDSAGYHADGIIEGVGALIVAVALVIAAVTRLGPRARLGCAAAAMVWISYGQTRLVYHYTDSNEVFVALGDFAIGVVLFVSALVANTAAQRRIALAPSGYPSVSGQQSIVVGAGPVAGTPLSVAARAKRTIGIGVGIAAIGIVITVVSYTAASHNPGGGRYFVAFGPVIIGGLAMIRGFRALRASSRIAGNATRPAPPHVEQHRAPPPPVHPQPAPEPPGTPRQPAGGFCASCGTPRTASVAFCLGCGHTL